MRIAIVLIEGLSGARSDALGGERPLDHARTPHLDRLAGHASIGRATVEPMHAATGVEAALAALLGADPVGLAGRGAFDAIGARHPHAAAGGRVAAARFVTTFERRVVGCDGAALRESEAGALCQSIVERFGVSLVPVGGNQAVLDLGGVGGALPRTMPPERLGVRPVDTALPAGPGADRLVALMDGAAEMLESHPVNAVRLDLGEPPLDRLWLWGCADLPLPDGATPAASGAIATRTLWAAGMARAFGMEALGGDAGVCADDAAIGRETLGALGRHDLVVAHCGGPRWAAQQLDPVRHATAIASIDRHVIGPLVAALGRDVDRIAVVGCNRVGAPDHIGLEPGPSPFLVADAGRDPRDARFDEATAAASALVATDAAQLREYVLAPR